MSQRPATISQADVARVLRAAKKTGATAAEIVIGGGTVRVFFDGKTGEKPEPKPVKRRPLI